MENKILKFSNLKRAILAFSTFFFFSATVIAATSTGTFTVNSTVAASCTVAATNLAFGSYTLAQLDATSTLTVTCTNGTAYNVGLDAGTFSGATTATRKMSGPTGNSLAYGLFTDANRTTIWGNVVGTSTVAGTGTGTGVVHTVYGRIPAGQTSIIGNYSDTITITITF